MTRDVSAATRGKDKSGQVLAVISILLVWGLISAPDLDRLIGYASVTVASFIPLLLWFRSGSPGLPVYPLPGLLYYVYYALPVLREAPEWQFSGEMVLEATLTAVLFIGAATVAWAPFVCWGGSRVRSARDPLLRRSSVLRLVIVGLALGFAYHLIAMFGLLGLFGMFNGTVRAVLLAASLVATYLLGCLRAKKLIDGGNYVIAIFLLGGTIAVSLVSLFLVTSILYLLTAIIGYSVTSRQVPWRLGVVSLALVALLHFGKGDMRQRYWVSDYDEYQSGISLSAVPGFLAEWFGDGVSAVTSGEYKERQDLLTRGSLLTLLMRVQAITPASVPFLGGESYSYIPQLLVPRFLVPGKPVSQASMMLLNVRYGIQSEAAAEKTAIGWGLIAEAYANFGLFGVGLIGIVFGVLTGAIGRLTVGASPLSWRNFVGVMGMMTLLNPEADLSYILVNLWQAIIAIALFHFALRVLAPSSSNPRVAAIGTGPGASA